MEFTKDFNPEILTKKLIPVIIKNDLTSLKINDKNIINLLINCAKVLENVFLIQKYKDNIKIKNDILKTHNKKAIDFFKIMGSPFDHFNNDEPYIAGVEKSIKAGFYPEDITKVEWEKFLNENENKKEDFTSPYTIILRDDSSQLYSIPYDEYFRNYLNKASEILNNAMEFAYNETLKSYLNSLSKAFINNNYQEADINFVLLKDCDIMPLFGPHEFYIDKFLGCKAAFTSLISIKNPIEFKKIEIIKDNIEILYERLPVPAHYKKQKRGELSKIEIVDLVYSTGDIRIPIHAAAFNLPNSERIKSEYGSKKVLIYNIMKLKFENVLIGISKLMLDELDRQNINFNAYFNFVLLHEVSHELGIGFIKDTNGKMKEVSYFLKDLYTVIEEAKADVLGIYSLIYLIKTGLINDCSILEICTTYLINLIRDIRFGVDNAHGMASLIQINYLINEGIFIPIKNNTFITINLHKFENSIENLLINLLTLEGSGNYEKTNKFIDKFSNLVLLNINNYLKRIENLPIDILPIFPEYE